MLIYSCVIYALLLLLAVDYRCDRHRRAVEQGFLVEFLIAVVAWLRQRASALLFALLVNAILIYSCVIRFRFAARD